MNGAFWWDKLTCDIWKYPIHSGKRSPVSYADYAVFQNIAIFRSKLCRNESVWDNVLEFLYNNMFSIEMDTGM